MLAAYAILEDLDGITLHLPKGPFYLFPRVHGVDSRELLRFFKREFRDDQGSTAVITPGGEFFFGYADEDPTVWEFFRIACVLKPESMKRAARTIAAGIQAFRNR